MKIIFPRNLLLTRKITMMKRGPLVAGAAAGCASRFGSSGNSVGFSSFQARFYQQTKNNKTILLSSKPNSEYAIMSVNALKDECRKRGIKISGRKMELVHRLVANDKSLEKGFHSGSKVGLAYTKQNRFELTKKSEFGSTMKSNFETTKKSGLKSTTKSNFEFTNKSEFQSTKNSELKSTNKSEFKSTIKSELESTSKAASPSSSASIDNIKIPVASSFEPEEASFHIRIPTLSSIPSKSPSKPESSSIFSQENVVIVNDSHPISSQSPVSKSVDFTVNPSDTSSSSFSSSPLFSTPFFAAFKDFVTHFKNSRIVSLDSPYVYEEVVLTSREKTFFAVFGLGVVLYWGLF